jgi:hypothetical protein
VTTGPWRIEQLPPMSQVRTKMAANITAPRGAPPMTLPRPGTGEPLGMLMLEHHAGRRIERMGW